jgi:beta-galactosidase
MPQFYVKDSQYWLDEQPLFVHAGEFHYFRTPVDQWEHRLSLLRDAGFNTVACYIPWLWHEPESNISDLNGHTHPMRNLEGFLDLAAEMGFYIIPRPGPYIMAETINEGIPPWVFSQYPQTKFISQDGKAHDIASYLHPDFLACVDNWYKAVFHILSLRQVSHGGKIIMVQLDNEMGMIQWVRNIIDLNPDTLSHFATYLQERYGESLSEHYSAANLPDFLYEQISQPQANYAITLVEDYRRFYRGYLRDYAAALLKSAKSYGMEVPPIVNIHGFGNGGKTFPIGLSQLVEVMEMEGWISATDVYPIFISEGNCHQLILVNEITKALQIPEQALFSIEFQAGGNQDFGGAQSSLYDLHSRLCISVGMRAINHYLFFDGENDPVLSPTKRHNWGHPVRKDGTLRRQYGRYSKLSRVINAYGEDLLLAQPKNVTTIGFLLDYFMTEYNNSFSRPNTDILTHQRDIVLFDFIARGLTLSHRPFDALEVTRASLDPAKTPLLWLMIEKQADAATQQKLVDYVKAGGKLILVGRLPEETFDHSPCTILKDALGIQSVHNDPPFIYTNTIQAFHYGDVPISFLESYNGSFDEVFATSKEGQAVGFIKNLGKGQTMVFGAALPANTLDDLDILNQMANRMGCPALFSMTDWADVRLSEGEKGNFLFVNNYQDDPLETMISSNGEALFGGHSLVLPARRGYILPLEWQLKQGILLHYLTSELIEVTDEGSRLILKTAEEEFFAELSLSGYRCDSSLILQQADQHFSLHGNNGIIELTKD